MMTDEMITIKLRKTLQKEVMTHKDVKGDISKKIDVIWRQYLA